MYYVGLDAHWKTSTACILTEHGQEVKTFTVRGGWSKMIERLGTLAEAEGQRLTVCYEASCGYGALYDQLAKIAHRIVVAHPGHLRLIYQAKNKTDRIDAGKLAKLLCLDLVPAVHVPNQDVRSWRQLIEFRRRCVEKRSGIKNAIQSLLKSHDIRKPRELRSYWTQKGRAWLGSIEWPTPTAQVQSEMLLEELDQANERVKRLTKQLDLMAKRDPRVILLQTIPGVGPRTAEAIVAYIDDPHRFPKNKQVASYFGLTPSQAESADVSRFGHITKQGPPTARKLLTEAAWQGICRNRTLRAYFERIAAGKKDRRKIALIATAHYLVRVMLSMLKTGEVWRGDTAPGEPAAEAEAEAA